MGVQVTFWNLQSCLLDIQKCFQGSSAFFRRLWVRFNWSLWKTFNDHRQSLTFGTVHWNVHLYYTCILILFCSWLMCTGRLHISFFSQSESINFFECIINTVTYSCTHVQFFLGDCASNVRSTTFSKLPRRFPLRFWCPSPLKDQL